MKEIDYDRYWSDAWAAARQARDNIPDVARDARLARWPKVFIYELTDALNESFRPDAASTKDVFGSALRWDDAAFRSSVHRKDCGGTTLTPQLVVVRSMVLLLCFV